MGELHPTNTMTPKNGGQVESLKGKIEEITVRKSDSTAYGFELWINDSSLSYLSLEEVLKLRDEINREIKQSINCDT